MKISQMSSAQIEIAVASCLGHSIRYNDVYGVEVMDSTTGHAIQGTDYTSSWNDAGPVLEKMRSIGVLLIGPVVTFSAFIDGDARIVEVAGPFLSACMRCFVEVVMGHEAPADLAVMLAKLD
jgi:hypothetical protein